MTRHLIWATIKSFNIFNVEGFGDSHRDQVLNGFDYGLGYGENTSFGGGVGYGYYSKGEGFGDGVFYGHGNGFGHLDTKNKLIILEDFDEFFT